MTVLGIDPGYATIGFGVVEKDKNCNRVIDYGIISTPKDKTLPERLCMISEGINALIEKYKPDAVAVEELFFARNVTTALGVAHARGVILVSAMQGCGKLFEYTPLQIKQALTGYGRADKNQMKQMVKMLLCLKKLPAPDDAADALAVALCHIQTNRFTGRFKI